MGKPRTIKQGGGGNISPNTSTPNNAWKTSAWRVMLACLIVGSVVAWVQSPVLECQALSFDDDDYLTSNNLVCQPSWPSAGRFMSEVLEPSTVKGYYQPLSMISLMLDYAAGGRPDHLRPFHRTGLVLHVACSMLVVVLIVQLFNSVAAASLCGLLFGLHPVATEVLPWIAQRKTLLASLFALACLVSYVSWAHRRRRAILAVSNCCYVLALLSKPTALPIVVVLLALDWWPLRRLSCRALIEKIPFIVIAAVFAAITVMSQTRAGGTTSSLDESALRPLLILGYALPFYARQLAWPVGWPGYYLFPDPFSMQNAAVLGYVAAFSVSALALLISLRWTRAIVSGAAIFVLLLFPTLGVIGFTEVIAANRFLYLPMIGALIPLGFVLSQVFRDRERTKVASTFQSSRGTTADSTGDALAADQASNLPHIRRMPRTLAAITFLVSTIICISESIVSRQAIRPWNNTLSLCAHLATVAPRAGKVRYNYGNALGELGRSSEAIREYEAAVAILPNYDQAHNNLAIELNAVGRTGESIEHFETAIALNPGNVRARANFGAVLLKQGALARAIIELRQAVQIDPGFIDAWYNLGAALSSMGDWSGAAQAYEQAALRAPNDGEIQARLNEAQAHINPSPNSKGD